MNQDTPILMITLQIPILADTSTGQVLDAIAEQVSDALEEIKKQQAIPDPEPIPQTEFNDWVIQERNEAFSDTTESDLLTAMGYAPRP